jgi:hypothetical protein
VDFYGDDLLWLTEQTLASCGEACRTSAGCVAFTLNTETRACILKRGLGQRVPHPSAMSGIMQVAPPPVGGTIVPARLRVSPRTDYYGGDYRNIKNVSHIECQAACLEASVCVAYTYVSAKGSCWLKSNVKEPSYDDDMVSGVKY